MNIHGFITLTLLDYPEHLAASIFLGGCNLRCPFCQNGNLVLSPENEPSISEEEVLELQREEFNEAMDPLRPLFAKSAVKTKEICLVGNPGDEISAFARKRKLDIIVMGSHGYGRFKSAVMGSGATRIAASSNVPLLVIRTAS